MQTVAWMAYSGSSHFSDSKTYKTLFISSYQSKDMNFVRLEHILQFSAKPEKEGTFLTAEEASHNVWRVGPESAEKITKRVVAGGDSNSDLQKRGKGLRPLWY
jgi:hypothetical protein